MQQRTFDGEGHRECEQPLPSALGSVISGLGGSNEAELAIVPGGVFPTTSGGSDVENIRRCNRSKRPLPVDQG